MGRSPCCEKEHTNKGAWTKEEDQRLINYINRKGEGNWRILPKAAGLLRCGKSCRLRWINYLRPDLKRGNFTQDEDEIIIKLHSLLGNKWSVIAGRLPGRTDNEIKNYWNTHIKRKLISNGIDPQTHRPFNSATATAAAAASPNTCLDFRNSTPPPSKLVDHVVAKIEPTENICINPTTDNSSSSVDDDAKCNSSTTEESHPPSPPPQAEDNTPTELDLELSIGLPNFQSKYTKSASLNSSSSVESNSFLDLLRPRQVAAETPSTAVVGRAMCRCWLLGFDKKADQLCSNCQPNNIGLYRY